MVEEGIEQRKGLLREDSAGQEVARIVGIVCCVVAKLRIVVVGHDLTGDRGGNVGGRGPDGGLDMGCNQCVAESDGLVVLTGIWKVMEPFTEGRSLLKLPARDDLGELRVLPASERDLEWIWLCMTKIGAPPQGAGTAGLVLARVALKIRLWRGRFRPTRSLRRGA